MSMRSSPRSPRVGSRSGRTLHGRTVRSLGEHTLAGRIIHGRTVRMLRAPVLRDFHV